MAYTNYIASYGSGLAGSEVIITEVGTGKPATILTGSGGGVLTDTGKTNLDASGNLSVYIDTARSWVVSVNDGDVNPGSVASNIKYISASDIATLQGNSAFTYILKTAPYDRYVWNGTALVVQPTVSNGSVIGSGGSPVSGASELNTVVGIGNSIMRAQGVGNNTASFLEYCAAASNGAMKVIGNFGVNGAKSADVLAVQLPLALATTARRVIYMEATNDALNSVPVATHRANVLAIGQAVVAAGKEFWIVGSPPKNGFNVFQYNQADQRLAYENKWLYVNPWAPIALDGNYRDSTVSYDNTHPTPKGSRTGGTELWRLVGNKFNGSPDLAWTSADPNGAISNCLNLTNVSGVPTGWTGAAGVTHSCAEAGTGDVVGNWWKQTATAIAAWQTSTRAVSLPANWLAGDTVRMSARLRSVGFEANGSKLDASYPTQGNMGCYINASYTGGSFGGFLLREIDGDVNGVFSVDSVIPAVGVTGFNLQVVITQFGTVSGEFSIAQLQIHNLSLAARA